MLGLVADMKRLTDSAAAFIGAPNSVVRTTMHNDIIQARAALRALGGKGE